MQLYDNFGDFPEKSCMKFGLVSYIDPCLEILGCPRKLVNG